ncbi:MAG TPA: hypothetical protein VF057_07010 [Thermoanaerobaculia bacterium]
MDLLYVHLLLNHFPLVGLIGSLLLLAGALFTRSRDVAIAALIGVVLAALVAIPVYFTGEPAEHGIEGVSGVNHDAIEEHQDAALWAIIAMEAAGVVALFSVAVAFRRGMVPRGALVVTLIISLWAAAVIARTAQLGGKIRHTEIGGASATQDADDDGGGRGRGRSGGR